MRRLGFFQNGVTAMSGGLLDGRRVGALLDIENQGHKLVVGGVMSAITVLGGYLAYKANNYAVHPKFSNRSVSIIGSIVGLALAHIPLVYPHVHKRYVMKEEFEQLANHLKEKVGSLNIAQEKADKVIEQLKHCTLAEEKNSHIVETLGRRITILRELNQIVTDHNRDADLFESLLDDLLANNTLDRVYKREKNLNAVLRPTPCAPRNDRPQ